MRSGPTPHGTYNGYTNYRCRCRPCKDANAAYERVRKMRRKLPSDPMLAARAAETIECRVAAWKAMYAMGVAGRVADEIVRNRPVPVALAAAVLS